MKLPAPRYFCVVLLCLLFAANACKLTPQSKQQQETTVKTFRVKGKDITDYPGEFFIDSIPIQVSLPEKEINANFGLSRACINIRHEKTSDLKISLLSPSGTHVWLTNRNGGETGTRYNNTCFSNDGFDGFIDMAESPYKGEYIPDGRLSFFNNGQNPNGTWYLLVRDLAKEHTGKVYTTQLQFSNKPPGDRVSMCDEDNPQHCVVSTQADNGELLPDLVMLRPFTKNQISEFSPEHERYGGQLRFATAIANFGSGPLSVFGKDEWYCGTESVSGPDVNCANGEEPRQVNYQRVYSKQAGADTLAYHDVEAGSNYYDHKPGHNHYHVDDWVAFRLYETDDDGRKKKQVSTGSKVSFCLFDFGICYRNNQLCELNNQLYSKENLPNYGFGSFNGCDADVQGISVGGYDNYGEYYEGQYLRIPEGTPNGNYLLEIEVDPMNYYREENETNNVLSYPVKLTKQNRETVP